MLPFYNSKPTKSEFGHPNPNNIVTTRYCILYIQGLVFVFVGGGLNEVARAITVETSVENIGAEGWAERWERWEEVC